MSDTTVGVKAGWVLIKRGAYWRPNSAGYTNNLAEAGIYTDEESAARCENPDVTRKTYAEAAALIGIPGAEKGAAADDGDPPMAALLRVERDGSLPDNARRAAQLAAAEITRLRGVPPAPTSERVQALEEAEKAVRDGRFLTGSHDIHADFALGYNQARKEAAEDIRALKTQG